MVLQKDLIIVPRDILSGLITALHLHFNHATKHQLSQLFGRYFYAINSDATIQSVINNCAHCNSLIHLPKEIFVQTSSPTPTAPGQQFAADVIRRNQQKIFVTRDVFSSFTSASLIQDESADTLSSSLISQTAFLCKDQSTIQIDNAPGFQSLRNDKTLQEHGITIEFGRVKNPNKNPVAEKAIQEFEKEILRIDASGNRLSNTTLIAVINQLNSRIRNRGLSAWEILFRRDQITNEALNVDDQLLSSQQSSIREKNHGPSARSKATSTKTDRRPISIGSLVYLKSEGTKFKGRERYIVMSIDNNMTILQKINGSLFSSKRYEVPLQDVFPVVSDIPDNFTPSNEIQTNDPCSETSDDSDAEFVVENRPPANIVQDAQQHVRPRRTPKEPAWLRGEEWVKE